MRSLVNYAVLTLVLEKPSYGAEIGRRFEDRYGELLRSRWDHAYRSLDALEGRGYVERLGPRGSRRQPKTQIRGTDAGKTCHREWLRSPLPARSASHEFGVRLLSVEAGDNATVLAMLDRLEGFTLAATAGLEPEDGSDPLGGVFRERQRLGNDATLQWVWRLRAGLTRGAGAAS